MATSSPGGQTDLGMAPNLSGLLCYVPCCVGLIFSIVVAIVEKKSRFVRFHAFQSMLIHAGLIAIGLVFFVAQAVAAVVAGVLAMLVWVVELAVFAALLGLMIFMMVKAYNNEKQPLPYIGEMAEKWSAA
jgi:uncharacterized membrane protein